jgi:hypothetical protein
MAGPEQPAQRAFDTRRGVALACAAHERVDATVGSLQVGDEELRAEEAGSAREQNRAVGRGRPWRSGRRATRRTRTTASRRIERAGSHLGSARQRRDINAVRSSTLITVDPH